MMKRVWIITRRAGYNYGSSLQATAMYKAIGSLGYDACILNYDEYSKSIRWRIKPFLLDLTYMVLSLRGRIPLFGPLRYLAARQRQIQNFRDYETQWLKLSPKTLRTAKQLEATISLGDTCVCGSDQIWNPVFFDPIMFLDFGSRKNLRRIAYAPSFGISYLSSHEEQIKGLLQNFAHISVREDAGQKIIKELIGKDVPVVLDPTLLISAEEWSTIAATGKGHRKGYILCYFLGKERIPYDFIAMLSKTHSLTVVNLVTNRTRNNIHGELIEDASPADFLALVKGANFVCTDSFHASIFSILFKREFFTFKRFTEGPHSQNSRLKTLFCMLDLEDRIISITARVPPPRTINHSDIATKIAKEQLNSITYLRNALAS